MGRAAHLRPPRPMRRMTVRSQCLRVGLADARARAGASARSPCRSRRARPRSSTAARAGRSPCPASRRHSRQRSRSTSRRARRSSRRTPTCRSQPASNEKLAVTYAALVELGPGYRFRDRGARRGPAGRRASGTGGSCSRASATRRSTTADLQPARRRSCARAGSVASPAARSATTRGSTRRRTAPAGCRRSTCVESPPLSALVVDRGARDGTTSRDPALAAAALFDQLLRARGIDARGAQHAAAARRRAVPLATVRLRSRSRDVLQFDGPPTATTSRPSCCSKAIGAEAARAGHDGGRRRGRPARPRRRRASRSPACASSTAPGLSRDDRVTARELAALLVAIWSDPTLRDDRAAARSPVAGVTGTLRAPAAAAPRRAASSGRRPGRRTIASALSGYVGDRFAFVVDRRTGIPSTLGAHARRTASRRPLAAPRRYAAAASSSRRSSSVEHRHAGRLRLRELRRPGSSPTITPVVFFETLSETFAPSASSAARRLLARERLERAGDHVLRAR